MFAPVKDKWVSGKYGQMNERQLKQFYGKNGNSSNIEALKRKEDQKDGQCRQLSWESFHELKKDHNNALYYVSLMTTNVYGETIHHFVVEHGDEVVDHTLPKIMELQGMAPTTRMPKDIYYKMTRAHGIIKLDRDQFQLFHDVLYMYKDMGREFAGHLEFRKLMVEIKKKWRPKHSAGKNGKREFRVRFGVAVVDRIRVKL